MDLGPVCSDRTRGLEHHGPFDGGDRPQYWCGQDNPGSIERAMEESESFASFDSILVATPMAGSSGDGFP